MSPSEQRSQSTESAGRSEQLRLSRRDVLATGLVAGAALATPSFLAACGSDSGGNGSETLDTLKVYGPDVAALEDWSAFEQETGMGIDWKPVRSEVGIFVQQVVQGGAAENYHLLAFDGGIQQRIGSALIEPDPKRVVGWDKLNPAVLNSPQLQLDGSTYGIPAVYNADTFGYYPSDLGRVDSYSALFEDDRTRGKVALEDNWLTTLPQAATYLAYSGRASISDPANMSPEEAQTVVDFLISRKNAGQFRALWTEWEESISLLGNREVIAINCWEPAIRELQRQGKDVIYAPSLKEGYNKWIIALWIPRGAEESGALDSVYDAVEYFVGGHYGAHIAALRGYATARPDLALEYVKEHPDEFTATDREYIVAKLADVKRKFKSQYFWQNGAPDNLDAIESEWERFKQA